MAAALGHTQSLHTNALDEALALPTDFSARIARNTQIYLQEETDITRVVDPWAGSYYVERLTHELMHAAWALIQEVEELGGMAKAIETGIPKMRIEEAAARRQARIDSGRDIIVGVNAYLRTGRAADPGSGHRQRRRARIADQAPRTVEARARRRCRGAIALTARANAPRRAKAICWSAPWKRRASAPRWAKFPPRWKRSGAATRPPRAPSPASTRRRAATTKTFKKARSMAEEFEQAEGRRPRILVAKMGQDGHDRGAKVIATAFADIGFDVDIGPLFQTPREVARHAVESDVHVVGRLLACRRPQDAGSAAH